MLMRRIKSFQYRLTRIGDRFSQLCLRSFDKHNTAYLTSVVLASRILKIILIICSHALIPSHKATGVKVLDYVPSSPWIGAFVKPFLCWDASHFISIAIHGYTEEMSYAFFPLYPFILRHLGNAFNVISPFHLNDIERVVITGVIFGNIFFVLTCFVLNTLLRAQGISAIRRHCAILCFTINPASLFFSVIYTESLYALLSWTAMYLLFTRKHTILPTLLFAAASFTRSNGIFNAAFVFIFSLYDFLRSVSGPTALRRAVSRLPIFLATISPYILHSFFSYSSLCPNEVIYRSSVCAYSEISIYSQLQKKYWNVSFLSSFRFNQLPNILLATPTCIVILHCIFNYASFFFTRWRKNDKKYMKDFELLPFHIVMICNLFVCLCFAHIQVMTRVMFASCPLLHLSMADGLLEVRSGSRTFLVIYILVFNVLSVLLHPNFFPWT